MSFLFLPRRLHLQLVCAYETQTKGEVLSVCPNLLIAIRTYDYGPLQPCNLRKLL